MPVLRSQRTYPLVLSANALNVGIVAAYDWAAEDGSTTLANGKDHSGHNRHWTVPTVPAPVVTTPAGKGRDPSAGRTQGANFYSAASLAALGLAVGFGDFSIWKRIRTPSVLAGSNLSTLIWRITDGDSSKLQFSLFDVASDSGWHWFGNDSAMLDWRDNPPVAAGTITDLHITRVDGVMKIFTDGVLRKTIDASALELKATVGSITANGPYAGQGAIDAVLIDEIYWSRGLSAAEVAAHRANPYSYYDNNAAADSIIITAPTAGSVNSPNIAIAGTFAGASAVTSVEASFNGGPFAVIDAVADNNDFAGYLNGQAPGTGTLTVRTKSGAAIVASSTVANITVSANSIAFTVPNTPATAAVPNRLFQRNSSNQATVRITGSYVGTPTAIQYQWGSGAWLTLDAAPANGVFDKSVVLTGPGQAALSIRFANSTGISASIPAVGVGELFVTGGQSQHVGQSTAYVPALAPTGNPGWKVVEFDKSGVWRENVEALGTPYDSTGQGSYFGRLATYFMAAGIPVGFIPVAIGSTPMAGWAPGQEYYENMVARAQAVGDHKAVLWWQGEQDVNAGTSQAAHAALLNSSVDDWCLTRFPGKAWIIMNINNVGLDPVGVAKIRASIASVAANNARVLGIGDMLGKFSDSIHYGTGGAGEVNAVAQTAWNAINGAYHYTAVLATTVTFAVVDASGNALTGLTNLDYAFYDQARISDAAAPVKKGSTLAINGGSATIDISGVTSLAPGGTGRIVYSDAAGTMLGGGRVVVA